ncbi:hypothetical protein SAMN04487950_3566 [Halogranum rubrum]|uniref:Uncharacterized protein n=1 Tax=Halogranum rubrum TaxID=553466 RepID=A0A1I4H9F6_9EURY|nr:hypothetical protein [Halogranum rubrum]SFL38390.1 hypothetical protein SAMN04487950_3566 [Halogranum rubrum]
MPSSSLPTGTVSHARGDRTRPTDSDSDVDAPHPPTVRDQRLAVHDGGSQSRPDPSRDARDSRNSPDDADEAAQRITELEAEVAALERELARRDADHQEIIHRYEHVLAETNVTPKQQQTDVHPVRSRVTAVFDRAERAVSVSRTTDAKRQADTRPLRERLLQLLPWR